MSTTLWRDAKNITSQLQTKKLRSETFQKIRGRISIFLPDNNRTKFDSSESQIMTIENISS